MMMPIRFSFISSLLARAVRPIADFLHAVKPKWISSALQAAISA
jgi:hypothetical protein